MQLLYFGWVRQRIGLDMEEVELPDGIETAGDLVGWLEGRGDRYAKALADRSVIRVAVNQELTDLDTPVAANDEVAFFPPMTGG